MKNKDMVHFPTQLPGLDMVGQIEAIQLVTERNLEAVEFALRQIKQLVIENERVDIPAFFQSIQQDLFVILVLMEGLQKIVGEQPEEN